MSKENETFISRTSGLKGKDYIGYALGDLAGCLCFSLITTLLQKFYTDVFHLAPLFIMIMFIAARVWDALNDPIMGRICDRKKPGRFGKYRPWFVIVAGPLAIATILVFTKWPGLGGDVNMTLTCVYATVTYFIFGMVYTVLQIPYGSLASVVTTDASERSKLSTFRAIGAAVGSIPVLLITSFAYKTRVDDAGNPVIGANGKAITDMQYTPVIIGVIAICVVAAGLLVLTFLLNKERVVQAPKPAEKGQTKKAVGALLKNRAFLSLSFAALLLLAGQMFTQSYYVYLFNDYFGANWMNMVSMVCTYSPMAVLMFFMPKLVRRFGKKEVCASGMALACVANLILFCLRGVAPSSMIVPFLALCFLSGCGLSVFTLQMWSMATDAIDDIEVKTGRRDDGTAYSFFNFFRKLGQVVAAIAVNGALLGMNYAYEKGAVQTPENLKIMYDLATLIPAAMFGLMALILFVWFPLSKKKVAEIQIAKEARLKEKFEANEIEIH